MKYNRWPFCRGEFHSAVKVFDHQGSVMERGREENREKIESFSKHLFLYHSYYEVSVKRKDNEKRESKKRKRIEAKASFL